MRRCRYYAASEYAQLAQLNATQVEIPETTLSALVAEQAAKTPDAPALADARYLFSYREMREQVVALANLLRERGVKPGGQRGGGTTALGLFDHGTPCDS